MLEVVEAKLVKKEQLKENIFKFTIQAFEIAKNAKPGQFLEIRVSNKDLPFLRRPISIFNINNDNIEIIFQVKGDGTNILSEKEVGDKIDILGPLGNGFTFDKYKKIAIIGGGIGVFPLYELAKEATTELEVNTYLGFRNKEFVLCEEEFKDISNKTIITTDDGSYGQAGFAINFLKEDFEKDNIECIYACGPIPMLRAVQKFAIEKEIPCQISLEQLMGCGFGVCLGCAVKLRDGTESKQYERVCKEGPVFLANRVEI